MKRIDYDDRLHRVYALGRALPDETMDAWMAAFARHTTHLEPTKLLDLGSGTGRFSGALAETFGGAVFGVEPSGEMMSAALEQPRHPGVQFVRGVAEAIPLRDGSIDVALLYFVLHHFPDKRLAAAELARVLAPDGVLLIRTNFSDRMPDVYWYQFFRHAREIDASMYQRLDEVVDLFTGSGFHVVALEEIEFLEARTKRELLERLRHRAVSTFELMDERDIQRGFAAMERVVGEMATAEPVRTRGNLLVLRRN